VVEAQRATCQGGAFEVRAIAGAFSVTELLGTYKTLNELGYSIIWTFVWIAVGYLIITLSISALFNVMEKRWGVAR